MPIAVERASPCCNAGLTARVSRRLMWVVGVALTAACLAVLVAIVT